MFFPLIDAACPYSTWTERDGSCYLVDTEARVNFADALATCEAFEGSSLASIHSEAEQSFLEGKFTCKTMRAITNRHVCINPFDFCLRFMFDFHDIFNLLGRYGGTGGHSHNARLI